MNLWPAEDPAGICEGLAAVSLPLCDRLAVRGSDFGVGLWLPAKTARLFAVDASERDRMLDFLEHERLDAFTFNAFPFGDFHRTGLKAAVFEPDWTQPERATYTRDVAAFGRAHATRAAWQPGRHLSISTHTGAYLGPPDSRRTTDVSALRQRVATQLNEVIVGLNTRHEAGGVALVLGLEPEPRSLAGDTRELGVLFDAFESIGQASHERLARIGVCLDACHAAVEFESVQGAHRRALGLDHTTQRPLAKLQFSSALTLAEPALDRAGFEALLALDEPVYLHQVTGRSPAGLLRCSDLDEIHRNKEPWLAQDELRCHFHVPVDLAAHSGLGTTSGYAGELLGALLAAPHTWGTNELHIEIETYTWSLNGSGSTLVDGIEAEYRHVIALLAQAGWFHTTPR